MPIRVVVVGAGVVGASIARVLTAYENFRVVVVERRPDVGWGVSKANTAIVHPCHEEDPRVHPLRAQLCRRGNRLWRQWARELEIPLAWPGELMVFTDDEEERRAREYLELARLNGIEGVRMVYGEELRELEPAVSPQARGALYAPDAGLIFSTMAPIAIMENAVDNGAKLLVETEVKAVAVRGGRVVGVETNRGLIEADIVVNAAGLHADEISHSAGVEPEFRIRPRRGQYMVFEPAGAMPEKILHTTPTPVTKGVYAVNLFGAELLLGPTAEDLPHDAKEDAATTQEGLAQLMKEAARLLRDPPPLHRLVRTFAGLRPEPPGGRWLIKAYTDPWGFVNVAGIRSPGLTAAPAIAEYVVEQIAAAYDVKLRRKEGWNPHRRDISRAGWMPLEELGQLAGRDPAYGQVLCPCRMVTKAEVLEAVERIRGIGARVTLDGIKYRTHATAGICQGAMCRWKIAKEVSRATGIPPHALLAK